MSDNFNAWNEMFKINQNMMKAWMDALPKRPEEEPGESEGFDFTKYEDWTNLQKQWMENWQNILKNVMPQDAWYQGPYSTWTNIMNSYNPFSINKFMEPVTRDVFEKMLNSQKLYAGLYEQWKKFNDEVLKPGTDQYKENIDKLVEEYNKIFTNNLIPLLPKEFQGLVTDTQSYFNTYLNTLTNFVGPWSFAYQNIEDIFMQTAFKDPMKLSDTLKEWKKAYDKTFGVLIKSPVVGSAREVLEQNNKAIEAMIEMLVSVSEFMTKAMSAGYEKSKAAFADYIKSIDKGEEPKTFSEFYDMWSKYVEDAIESYFYTDEFSKLIAKAADSAMIFKIEYDKVIEKALKDLPIVTMSEVDNVYKNVYNLKREIRSMKKELEQIKEENNNKPKESK